MTVRLLVVDDHTLFRRGLAGLLREMPEFEVAGEAANGQAALDLIRQVQPDLVLMDVHMPEMNGIQAVQAIRAQALPVRVLMLTVSQNDADLLGAIQAGADGYLLKNAEPEDLRSAILRLMDGQGVLSPEVTASVLKAVAHRPTLDEPGVLLSQRELDVLNCLAEGQTTLQIAANLFISENTVKTHIRHILEKFEAANRTEAVSKALRLGLIVKKNGNR